MNFPPRRSFALAAVVAAVTRAASALAEAPAPDTGAWLCAKCPFYTGAEAEGEAGALVASGANANFGRYTGIDKGSPYVDGGATATAQSAEGSYLAADMTHLGLASREATLSGGRDGRYALSVSYDDQPSRQYDSLVTPYRGRAGNLELPGSWVTAASTSSMSGLANALQPLSIGTDRRTVSMHARYFVAPAWTVFGELQRQEKTGTGLTSASFLTEAVQLPSPVNYVTDSLETGVAWAGRQAAMRVSYTGSWFEDNTDALNFANPYLPIVPGSTQGQVALPPSNELQQVAASGNVRLPWWATTVTFRTSLGRLTQDHAFLPVSTLQGSLPIVPGSLGGDVRLSNYALGLGSHPLPKLSVHGNATYDGRDDRTPPVTVAYVVTDTFPGGTVTTPRYGQDRTRLDGGADYGVLRWLRVGIGGRFQENRYAPGQVISHSQDTESFGRATAGPLRGVSVTLKVGNGLRKVAAFDVGALPANENPLTRAYNYAPRDRVFSSLLAAWEVNHAVTWSLEGQIANDDYRSSPLGLQSAHDRRISTTLSYAPGTAFSAYVDGGYQRLFTRQNGATGSQSAPWLLMDSERNWNMGVGGRWAVSERWAVGLDGVHAPTYATTDSLVGGSSESFPGNWTRLDSLRLDVGYQWTRAASVHLRLVHEAYNSSDWALDGVGPATIPNLLAVGVQPYQDRVNLVALTFRYRFTVVPVSAP